ncbi:MAG TPA: hypothetical protein VGF46_01855 [Gaiellales bacterium]
MTSPVASTPSAPVTTSPPADDPTPATPAPAAAPADLDTVAPAVLPRSTASSEAPLARVESFGGRLGLTPSPLAPVWSAGVPAIASGGGLFAAAGAASVRPGDVSVDPQHVRAARTGTGTRSSSPAVTPVSVAGGRSAATAQPAPDPGWGFGSPLGRFAITRSSLLLGASDDGAAGARLSLPLAGALAGLAILLGSAAVLGLLPGRRRRVPSGADG